jgi:hypothetical protein
MIEITALLIIYIVFLVASLLLRKWMIKVRTNWIYVCIPIYLLAINSYFDLINWYDDFLRDRKIYIDFGHAKLDLLLLCLLTFVTALFFIINIIYKRYRKRAIA